MVKLLNLDIEYMNKEDIVVCGNVLILKNLRKLDSKVNIEIEKFLERNSFALLNIMKRRINGNWQISVVFEKRGN